MRPITLLLVDDEKPLVDIMARRLRQRGFDADCAYSGLDALDRLRSGAATDVVVLDIKMPALDGIETVARIKRDHPLVEVIMLTGHATIDSAVESIKRGAFDYLTKPCQLDELIAKAERAASRKKAREAKILEARTTPYISKKERDKRIADILGG